MPLFDYKAKDRAGTTVTGSIDALDERGAAEAIRGMGHLPMTITPATSRPSKTATGESGGVFARYILYPLWTGINIRMLAAFYRQLATLLAAGMSISESLRSIGSRSRGRFGVIIREAQQSTATGGSLSDSLSRHPKVFSRLQITLVRAGESGGRLDQMTERIAQQLEYEMKVRGMLDKATLYQRFVLIMAFLVAMVISQVNVLVNDGFAAFVGLVLQPVGRAIGALVLFIVAVKLVFQFSVPRLVWDTIKIRIPFLGSIAHKIAMSRFSKSLAILYSSGLSMPESVDLACDACGNLSLGRSMRKAIPEIRSGVSLSEALDKTGAVLPMVMDMMIVGERTGSTDTVLEKVADYMDDEVDASIRKMAIALNVVMILIAGAVVGSIVLNFYTGYFKDILGIAGQ
ncbi:MAG: type II secretion system F family protein [Armatimonadota bacterium]|jgi:type IV pilus assembly protein PilC